MTVFFCHIGICKFYYFKLLIWDFFFILILTLFVTFKEYVVHSVKLIFGNNTTTKKKSHKNNVESFKRKKNFDDTTCRKCNAFYLILHNLLYYLYSAMLARCIFLSRMNQRKN